MNNIMITACSREVMSEAMHFYCQGITIKAIATHMGYHHTQMNRYLRLWSLYGPTVFITEEAYNLRPKKDKSYVKHYEISASSGGT